MKGNKKQFIHSKFSLNLSFKNTVFFLPFVLSFFYFVIWRKQNKIIIVDDHSLFREGIKLLIENENLGEVIGEAENGQAFLDMLEHLQPDLVIMDNEMSLMSGLETTSNALRMRPDLKILVLTMLSEMANYLDIVNAGAMGIVLKTSGKTEFEKAIKVILNGQKYFSYELLNQIIVNSNLKSQTKIENSMPISDYFANQEKEFSQRLVKV